MNLEDKVRFHLQREARDRVVEQAKGKRLRPAEMAARMNEALRSVDQWLIEATIYHSPRAVTLCQWIAWRFGHEHSDEEKAFYAAKINWRGEVAREAYAQGYPLARAEEKTQEALRSVSWISEQEPQAVAS